MFPENVSGVVVLVLVLRMLQLSSALQCYDCLNVEMVGDDSSGVFKLLQGNSNPQCGANPSSENIVTCPSGASCGAVIGDLKGSMLGGVFGKLHAQVQVRGCVSGSSVIIGCKTADREMGGLFNKVLAVVTGVSDLEVDGEMCSCAWDLCIPDCGSRGLHIGDTCIPWWVVIVVVVGGVLFCVLCITCCCCCCRGCCCRKTPGRVISAPAPPYQTLMVFQQQPPPPPNSNIQYNMSSVQGLENPMFGRPEIQAVEYSRLEQA